ncbi:MAG: hypothetical protein GX159_03535 [Flavobacteriaceae bacterium]|jgi:hypothetical protein|nr:hypothetical protein [Flavobacteriaceae bacterium]
MNSKARHIISLLASTFFLLAVFFQPIHQFTHNHLDQHEFHSDSSNDLAEIDHSKICFLCDFTLPVSTEFSILDFDLSIQDNPFYRKESFEYQSFFTSELKNNKQLRAPPILA